MKKVMFLVLFCDLSAMINCFHLDVPMSQQNAKKEMVFTNGKSYQDLEDELRLKHPNEPESIIIKGYGLGTEEFENKIINPVYCSNYFPFQGVDLNSATGSFELKEKSGHYFLIPEKITESNYDTARFLLTHEIGHSQFPNLLPAVNTSIGLTFYPIAYYWKKTMGSAPYRNRFTKYGSKIIAANILSTLAKFCCYQLEERRADNFAIKHSDASMLQGALEGLQEDKKQLQKEYSKTVISKVLPFRIGWNLKDPLHPSLDSRIAKVKAALKTKFNIEA
ncbi:M48 family metalloprotease [Candidatus Babeliales bacterium]|nr:M48 family metalloprotease [Candidatus Babeliales bacterium]